MDVAPGTDLRGLRLVECDLRGARLVGCEVDDVRIDAWSGDLGSLVVEGVEVSGFVHAELDRRFPERVAVRGARTAEDLRAAWHQVHRLWLGTGSGFHPLGLPTTDAGPTTYTELGLDADARPPWDDVVTAFTASCDRVTAAFAAARDDALAHPRVLVPYRERGELRTTVRRAYEVLLREHVDHRRYALRDLAVLGGR